MSWRIPAAVALLSLAAAAAPPSDCGAIGDSGQVLPLPLDLAGRPDMAAGLAGHGFATLPGEVASTGCHNALPTASQVWTLRSESSDVLHGLPAPDILRPISEPRQAPHFQ
jgi:hypothetical protein